MKKQNNDIINFFSYVQGDTSKLMAAIFGRKNISHEKAILLGYEMCIQTAKDVTDQVLPTCPFSASPREILIKHRGPDFELYTIRPNQQNKLPGTIWYVSAQEYEYLRNYELIDCGLSEDIIANAITDNGDTITVNTYGLKSNADNFTMVVDINYRRPEIPNEEKIKKAIRERMNYIRRHKISNLGKV